MLLYRVCRLYCICNSRNILKLSRHNLYTVDIGHRHTIVLEDDKRLTFEHGSMARFASGAAVFKLGGTAVLVTAVAGSSYLRATGMVPLSVDYRQTFAAAGRIPTNMLRRELGPTEKELLTSRMIDRSLRPLFPEPALSDIQITCKVLAVDGVHDPAVLCINAASAALTMSDIPWDGPVAAIRVATKHDGSSFIAFPTRFELQKSKLNLVVVSHQSNNIVMLEGTGENVPWSVLQSAIEFGVEKGQKLAESIANDCCVRKTRRPKKPVPSSGLPENLKEMVYSLCYSRVMQILDNTSLEKISRDDALKTLRFQIVKKMEAANNDDLSETVLHETTQYVMNNIFRDQISRHSVRCDGRSLEGIRPINCSVDLYEPLHGSAMFQRGQTQVFATVAFDSLAAAARLDPVSVLTGSMKEKNFMLHYQFPGFAVNEVRSADSKGNRREIGHGALAENGLRPVVPDNYPFSIRVTADVLESNGSSSMASVCAGCMALMDAGVPITEPVAGVAMGIICREKTWDINRKNSESSKSEGDSVTENILSSLTQATCDKKKGKKNKIKTNEDGEYVIEDDDEYIILTDLAGIEDYNGDMDCKIAGTRTGFTAIQADIKLNGVPVHVIADTISHARHALNRILKTMSRTIRKPRSSRKGSGPLLEDITVLPADRYKLLGVGGYNLKKITKDTGVSVTPVDESTYQLFAPNPQAMEEAKAIIAESMEKEVKAPELDFGAVYDARIVDIRDIGVMVQMHPAMTPVLLHNSQLDQIMVSHPSALGLVPGQIIKVKYFGRDPTTGNMRISRKAITMTAKHISFFKDT